MVTQTNIQKNEYPSILSKLNQNFKNYNIQNEGYIFKNIGSKPNFWQEKTAD